MTMSIEETKIFPEFYKVKLKGELHLGTGIRLFRNNKYYLGYIRMIGKENENVIEEFIVTCYKYVMLGKVSEFTELDPNQEPEEERLRKLI